MCGPSWKKETLFLPGDRQDVCLVEMFEWIVTMTRALRFEYPGAFYQVINRGKAGDDIFKSHIVS